MKNRKPRKWQDTDDDPTSGLINLFDIWMVFAVAVLLAFVQAGSLRSGKTDASAAASSEQLDSKSAQVMQMHVTKEKLSGEGERLGTAYRLKSGQVVYVPEQPK